MSVGRILDLSAFNQDTLDVKMPGGRTLRLPKPSQNMVIRLLSMRDMEGEDMLRAFDQLTLDILGSNIEGENISQEEVEAMPLSMRGALVSAYGEFLAEVQQNPI